MVYLLNKTTKTTRVITYHVNLHIQGNDCLISYDNLTRVCSFSFTTHVV